MNESKESSTLQFRAAMSPLISTKFTLGEAFDFSSWIRASDGKKRYYIPKRMVILNCVILPFLWINIGISISYSEGAEEDNNWYYYWWRGSFYR